MRVALTSEVGCRAELTGIPQYVPGAIASVLLQAPLVSNRDADNPAPKTWAACVRAYGLNFDRIGNAQVYSQPFLIGSSQWPPHLLLLSLTFS